MSSKEYRVLFVQKFVPHYRLPLFERLRSQLEEKGIEFRLIYGDPDPFEGSKVRMAYPEWGFKVNSKIIHVFGKYLYWQNVVFNLKKGDVVIVEQAAKLLDNYPLFLLQQIGFIKLCYFGHGKNFQDKYELGIARFIKKLMVRKVSKWFAYTEMSVDALVEQGVLLDRIVSVNNTLLLNTRRTESEFVRNKHQFLYIGGLYKDKRIEFLLEAAAIVYSKIPEFVLHVVGDGPDSIHVEYISSTNEWCVHHGSLYEDERDKVLFETCGILMPGAVGLVAVDSFHYACPLLTTNNGQHGPEYVYLKDRHNAMILEDEGTPEEYANMIIEFIENDKLADSVRQRCRDSSEIYTIDDTASRFIKGIEELNNN